MHFAAITIVLDVPPFVELVMGALATAFGWLFGKVIFRYIFLPWAAHIVGRWLQHEFQLTSREAIILRHYQLRRRGNIHQPRSPWLCEDGRCPEL